MKESELLVIIKRLIAMQNDDSRDRQKRIEKRIVC